MRNQRAPLLPVDMIARAERLDAPLLLDGLKAAKIEIPDGGCMAMEIIPIERGMKVVGTAMTIETGNGDNFPIHVASYSVKEDGYMVVIDGKECMGRTYFGDLIMGAYQAARFKGVAIGDCARDRDGNVKLGFPVYSRGFMPRGSIEKDERNINTPIMYDGVKVESGDLAVGDSDGVCVIPREHIETVLSETEKELAYEEDREKTIAAYRKAKAEGRELLQLAPQWILNIL